MQPLNWDTSTHFLKAHVKPLHAHTGVVTLLIRPLSSAWECADWHLPDSPGSFVALFFFFFFFRFYFLNNCTKIRRGRRRSGLKVGVLSEHHARQVCSLISPDRVKHSCGSAAALTKKKKNVPHFWRRVRINQSFPLIRPLQKAIFLCASDF